MAQMTEVADALGEIRQILQLDGADFELTGWDDASGVAQLRLVVDDVSCLECVMPEDVLRDITLASLQKQLPVVRDVRIDDPRD